MARLDDRGGRDAAGFGPYYRSDSELVPLRDLADWQLARGEPDIRGWEVRTVSGRTIGTVRDLLVDRHTREVVLLDLDLAGGHRRARAPLRSAQIDRVGRVLRMDSADLIDGEAAALHEDVPVRRERPDERMGERVVARPIAPAADLGDHRDDHDRHPDLDRDVDRDRSRRLDEEVRLGNQDRVVDHREAEERAAERLADSSVDERIVERRPVVYEEVVVRRRAADEDEPRTRPADEQ